MKDLKRKLDALDKKILKVENNKRVTEWEYEALCLEYETLLKQFREGSK